MKDSKYLVWKRNEMEKWMSERATEGLPSPVPDAVVIRRQDIFAPPAFDAYANAIQCVIEALLKVSGELEEPMSKVPEFFPATTFTPQEVAKRLQDVADYFHAQASIAYDSERKLPD